MLPGKKHTEKNTRKKTCSFFQEAKKGKGVLGEGLQHEDGLGIQWKK